jgi:glycosyltransferase involved in cell wall biosynthesis
MVMIEALACGTPVLAMNCGAVREVLRHGVTGLIGDTVDELVGLAPHIGELDRRVCRREAERRFSTQAMAEGYEQIYARLIAEQRSRRESI